MALIVDQRDLVFGDAQRLDRMLEVDRQRVVEQYGGRRIAQCWRGAINGQLLPMRALMPTASNAGEQR